jgi:riboflavin kinase/FMN adenylyltransferase
MQHFQSLESVQLQASWLTIGAFDGVHLGHQEILKQLAAGAHAHGCPAVVLTFYPHPANVLNPGKPLKYLTTPERRAQLLGDLGADVVITYPFDRQVAQQSGRLFLQQINEHLDINTLWVGYDFAMGHNRDTGVAALQQLGAELGFTLQVQDPINNGDQIISSSRIRTLLQDGNLETANRYLGRPYCLSGKIIPGDGRGRTIGIPTANLDFWEQQVIPARGVYACRAAVEGQEYAAATNIGVRPTFDGSTLHDHVEAHLLDADIDLYGKTMQLEFFEYLRGEQKFSNVEALVNQIHADIARTRRLLQS